MLGSKTTAPRDVGPVPKQTRMRHDPVQTVALESMTCREDGMPQDRDAFSHSRILAFSSRSWGMLCAREHGLSRGWHAVRSHV